MTSIREMQERIHSIESIGQLTRALQAVSASQVRSVRTLSENSLPYTEMAWQILTDLYFEPEFYNQSVFFRPPDPESSALIVFVSADRGLAGSFPANIFRAVYELEKQIDSPVEYVTIGKKGKEMLQRRRRKIVADFSGISSATSFHDLKALSTIMLEEFEKDHIGQIYLVYIEYESMSRFVPTARRLLPFISAQADIGATPNKRVFHRGSCVYEGDPDVIMHSMITRFLRMELFHAITASKVSEHTSRMLAMNKATENSEEIIQQLSLEYNKIRQQQITSDLLDIIGGSAR